MSFTKNTTRNTNAAASQTTEELPDVTQLETVKMMTVEGSDREIAAGVHVWTSKFNAGRISLVMYRNPLAKRNDNGSAVAGCRQGHFKGEGNSATAKMVLSVITATVRDVIKFRGDGVVFHGQTTAINLNKHPLEVVARDQHNSKNPKATHKVDTIEYACPSAQILFYADGKVATEIETAKKYAAYEGEQWIILNRLGGSFKALGIGTGYQAQYYALMNQIGLGYDLSVDGCDAKKAAYDLKNPTKEQQKYMAGGFFYWAAPYVNKLLEAAGSDDPTAAYSANIMGARRERAVAFETEVANKVTDQNGGNTDILGSIQLNIAAGWAISAEGKALNDTLESLGVISQGVLDLAKVKGVLVLRQWNSTTNSPFRVVPTVVSTKKDVPCENTGILENSNVVWAVADFRS